MNKIHFLILFFFSFQGIAQAISPSCLSFKDTVKTDYIAYYQGQGMPWLISGLAVAGTLANTTLDGAIQSTWQQQVKSNLTNRVSDSFEVYAELAQWKVALPIYLMAMYMENRSSGSPLFESLHCWGSHSLRALLIGAPQQAVLTTLLGSARPMTSQSSYWHWFKHDRAVSGHAFFGAIPFLNVAEQQPLPLIKITAYALSMLPALARINQNKHYTSQAFLGWWLAFSATRFVWHNNIVRKPQLTYFILPNSNAIYLCVIAKL